MTHQPLAGFRVLEVAQWTFVPAAGAVLADWGADVIKIEHPVTGDAQRGIMQSGVVSSTGGAVNVFMEHPNRGKRSVAVDIGTDEGRQLLYEMAETSDVFLTNFLPEARQRLGIDLEHLRAANPDIVYVRGTAHGDRGPERLKGGYDATGFWARAGSAASCTPSDLDVMISQPGPGYGDSMGGMTIAGGIVAALLGRERTGETSVVDVSLLSTGMWAMGLGIGLSIQTGQAWAAPPTTQAGMAANPLTGSYTTSDGRHIMFVMLQPGEYWADFCEHIGRPELAADERFADVADLMANAQEAAEIIREVIGAQTFEYWIDRFETLAGQWAPVQNTLDLLEDRQARANDYIVSVDDGSGGAFEIVASPVQFDEAAPTIRRAPDHGQHTDEMLAELGYDTDQIIDFKVKGAIL